MAMRVQGTVRWYNDAKGYGFIAFADPTSQLPRDVYVHFSDIQGNGFKTLEDGQAVEFEIIQGQHGPVAKEVAKL